MARQARMIRMRKHRMSNNEGIAKLRAKSGEDTLISFSQAFGVRTAGPPCAGVLASLFAVALRTTYHSEIIRDVDLIGLK